jgi:cyclic-di-GMP phosphodiesterase TipF (flagellum assembly factor)
MVRISAVVIAICMVLIAASIGAVLFIGFGVSATVAAVIAVAALTGMVLFNAVSSRLRDRRDLGDQIADLSRGTADLARQVGEISRRLVAAEGRIERNAPQPRTGPDPLAAEIGELGGLVKQLAETVAAHESALRQRAQPAAPEAQASAAPKDEAETNTAAVAEDTRRGEKPAGEASAPSSEAAAGRRFAGLSRELVTTQIAEAVDGSRIDLYLQPVVTLPQRKVRFYEAMSRLRMEDGEIVAAIEFIDHAEAAGLMPKIDNLLLFRCVQVMRRLQLKNRDVGLFCNVSTATLNDAHHFRQFLDFVEANRVLAPSLIFEFSQEAFRNFGPIENEALSALAERGYRFSLDHVTDLRLEPRDLAHRSFRFIKVPAKLLLDQTAHVHNDIHPADLADLLARTGVDLVIEHVENEGTVVDLLDYDVRFAQGFLVSPPRPVRADALQSGTEPAAAEEPDQAEPRLASGGRR